MIERAREQAGRRDRRQGRPNPVRLRPLPATGALAACAICGALAASLAWPPAPRLLWNASPSSPLGLYLIGSPADLSPGGIAIAWPPPGARRLAAQRHYLPANVPLVKTVVAVGGARVCALGRRITVDGRQAALRRLRDPSGRRLPWWSGCRRLRTGEIFLLSPHVPDAYDGRYFGATRASEVIGSGTLLWPR